jgi:hypothetical protein
MSCVLAQPFEPKKVIEDTLYNSFRRAWEKTYYFNPERNASAEHEGHVIFLLIKQNDQHLSMRSLQNFSNSIIEAVRTGHGKTIPFRESGDTRYCYVMIEQHQDNKPKRLKDFFGEAALYAQDIEKTSRLFDEFVARHETAHAIDLFEPNSLRTKTPLEAEKLADSYALLDLFREYGEIIFPFSDLVIKGREHQNDKNYNTVNTIKNVITFASNTENLRNINQQNIFFKARDLIANF